MYINMLTKIKIFLFFKKVKNAIFNIKHFQLLNETSCKEQNDQTKGFTKETDNKEQTIKKKPSQVWNFQT